LIPYYEVREIVKVLKPKKKYEVFLFVKIHNGRREIDILHLYFECNGLYVIQGLSLINKRDVNLHKINPTSHFHLTIDRTTNFPA